MTNLQGHITLGIHPLPDGESEEESLKLLTDLLLRGGGEPKPESDIVAQRWKKVLWWVAGLLLGPYFSLTQRETQERGIFEFVHSFAS